MKNVVQQIIVFAFVFRSIMSFFSRGSSSTPGVARPKSFPYDRLGPRQLRMLRYASNSTTDDIRLELTTVNRDARPVYTALSYV